MKKLKLFGLAFCAGVVLSAILIQFKVPQPIVSIVSGVVTFLIIVKFNKN